MAKQRWGSIGFFLAILAARVDESAFAGVFAPPAAFGDLERSRGASVLAGLSKDGLPVPSSQVARYGLILPFFFG